MAWMNGMVLLFLACTTGWLFAAEHEEKQELLRVDVSPGRQIVVLRVPLSNAKDLAAVWGASRVPEAACLLQVLLHRGEGEDVVLASRVLSEPGDRRSIFHGNSALNCFVGGSELVIPFTNGPRLGVWRIRMVGAISQDEIAWLNGWELLATMMKLDRDSVEVRGRQDKDGRWVFEVVDRRAFRADKAMPLIDKVAPFTTFSQSDQKWEFNMAGKPANRQVPEQRSKTGAGLIRQ